MRKKILFFLKNKSFKNGIWMYLLQFFNAIVPLLTLPYITRMLGASEYGVFSVAINIVNYLQVVVEYGFGMSATRKIALSKSNKNKLYTTVLFSRILLVGVCIIISLLYIFINKGNKSLVFCYLILLICLLGYCLQVNWLFQGLQDMKYISLVNIISRSISVALIFLFVKTTDDLYLYCFLYTISPFLSGFIGLLIAKAHYSLSIVSVSLQDVFDELKDGWYVFTTQLSSKVFGAIGITFMGIFASNFEIGIFSAIQKIPNILILGWTPIAQVLYPISSKKFQNNWKVGYNFVLKVAKIILPIFFMVSTILSFFSFFIITTFFGREYSVYYYWVIPLLYWIVLAILNNFIGVQILLASGKDKEYSQAFQISVIGTIIFNFVLIYFFHGNGACLAPLLSELLLCVLLIVKIKKIKYKVIES